MREVCVNQEIKVAFSVINNQEDNFSEKAEELNT